MKLSRNQRLIGVATALLLLFACSSTSGPSLGLGQTEPEKVARKFWDATLARDRATAVQYGTGAVYDELQAQFAEEAAYKEGGFLECNGPIGGTWMCIFGGEDPVYAVELDVEKTTAGEFKVVRTV